MKRNIGMLFFVLIVFGITVFIGLLQKNSRFNCDDWEQLVVETELSNIVVRKFYDRSNHMAKRLELDNGVIDGEVSHSKAFWEAVEVGDSLIKRAGSMTYYVKKTDTMIAIMVSCHPEEF